MVKRKNKIKISKDFFNTPRPTISTEEAFKDIIPAEWVDKKNKSTKKSLKLIKKTN